MGFKVKQYPAGVILVAESADEGIVGLINGAVKTVSLHWEDEPVGVLVVCNFLVHEDWQRKGIGRRLLDAAHEKGVGLGAKYASAQVGHHHGSALHVLEKLGYKLSSCRSTVQGNLQYTVNIPDGLDQDAMKDAQVAGNLAVKLLTEELKKHDQVPADLQNLIDSPLYLGTFVVYDKPQSSLPVDAACRDTESFAMVSVWNESGIVGFWLSRFVVPASVLVNRIFQAFLVGICLFALFLWAARIVYLIIGSYIGWTIWYLLLTFLLTPLVLTTVEHYRLVLAMARNKDGSQNIKVRFFAMSRRGEDGDKYMQYALHLAKNHASREGFVSFTCNLPTLNPLLRLIEGAPSCLTTNVLCRDLTDAQRTLPDLQDRDFSDPRDT